jgi:inhibitor of KinA sporulation pathway (predicted exonuclease)
MKLPHSYWTSCTRTKHASDNQFIERAFKLINADYPNIVIRCAMQLYSGYYSPTGRWCRLVDAAEHAGHVWSGNAHRALADAQATRSVWHLLRERNKISEVYDGDEYNHGCEF